MARTFAWRSAAFAAVAAAAFACKEQVTAPGHCPDLCSNDSLVVVDTVLTGVVVSDTSERGFTRRDIEPLLLASNTDSLVAYTLLRFAPLPQSFVTAGVADSSLITIDSVALELRLDLRDTTIHNLRLRLYKLSPTVDTFATFDSVSAVFAGAPFDSIPVDDTLRTTGLRRLLPVAAVTPTAADSFVTSIGIAVQADSQTTVRLLSSDPGGISPLLRYYVHGMAPRDTLSTILTVAPTYDTWVQSPEPPVPPSDVIMVGNQPASRSFLHFSIPSYFVDSVTVVRATLLLTPLRAVRGLASESISVAAQPVLRFLGGKSILLQDTSAIGIGLVFVGQTDTIQIEIGKILRVWRGINVDSLPRVITLRNINEDFTTVDWLVAGPATPATAPKLHISFVRPFKFGVP